MTITAGSRRLTVPRPRVGEPAEDLTRLPADLWARLLEDEETVERFHRKVYRRGPGLCDVYLGSLSSSGHGRFRAGTRAADAHRPGSIVVVSHVFAFLLSRGLPAGEPAHWGSVLHRCDEAGCQAPGHLAAGTPADNSQEFIARRRAPGSPLGDSRGPRGRAVAIRDAVRAGLARGATRGEIEAAIQSAAAAGIIGTQAVLF